VAHTSGIDFPAVTCLANGNFLVVWSEAVADGYALKGTIFDASGATVSENLLLAKNSDYIGNPDVVTLADGGFALAFSKYDSSNFISVFLATYSSTGTIVDGPVEEAQIGRTAGVVEPSLSLLKDGRYTLSYAGAGLVYDPRPTAVTWYGTDADEQYGGTAFGDRLSAGGGNDKFYGFGGNDSLDGGAGNDILVGGFGKDTLTGGAGKDAFLFTTFDARRASSNVDKITDYKVSDDSIWLESGNFKGGSGSETAPGQIKKAYFTVGTKAKDRNDYYIYDKKTGYLWYDVDGSGINFAKVIAKLSPGLKMTYKEFFMV
jgi:Ca2+-binding RTX toxin-like protein